MSAAIDLLPISYEVLADFCQRNHIAYLALFGSVARGDASPGSDFDLLFDLEPGVVISLFTLADMQVELERLLGRPVDLVPRRGLKAAFRHDVLDEARVLHEV